jgi:hypothetical protein
MTNVDMHIPSFRVFLSLELPIISKGFFSGESSSVGGRTFAFGSTNVLFERHSRGEDNASMGGGCNALAIVSEMPPPCCPPSRAFPSSPTPSGLVDPERLGSVLFVGILEYVLLLAGVRVGGSLDRLGEDDSWIFSMRSGLGGDFMRVRLSVAVWDISLEMPLLDEGSLSETVSLSPRRTAEDRRGAEGSRKLTPSVDTAAGEMASSRRTCELELLFKTIRGNQQHRQMTYLHVHIPSFPVVLPLELAGISKLFFAGESSSVGGRGLAPVASKALFEGFSGGELASGGRKDSIVFLETPLPCCPPSPACPPPLTPSGLMDSE